MQWSEIIKHPSLQDLPFKIETNEYGQIVMSAATNKHGTLQIEIGDLIKEMMPSGRRINECSIQTSGGVKVADVVWLSDDFIKQHGFITPYQKAPEICIEIVSRSNTKKEMTEKRKLYFERGAQEVWLCYESGKIEFYNPNGSIQQSIVLPDFPAEIAVPWSN